MKRIKIPAYIRDRHSEYEWRWGRGFAFRYAAIFSLRGGYAHFSHRATSRITGLRRDLKKGHIKCPNQCLCDVTSGLIVIDTLAGFEKAGDHAFNVAEGIGGARVFR